MNIYLHELKTYRKSTVLWTVTIVSLILFFMWVYPAFSQNANDVKKLLSGFPEAARKALSISIDDITGFTGFYSYIFVYVTLCGAIQAMNLGLSLVSREITGKTADFLLSKPVTRMRIATSKLLAGLTLIILTNAVYLLFAYSTPIIAGAMSFDMTALLMISATLFMTQLILLSIGFLISAAARRIKSLNAVSLGIVFGFFAIGMFGSVIGDKASRFITPFKYFESSYIAKHHAYELPYLFTGICIIAVSITLAYIIYLKKDIHAV